MLVSRRVFLASAASGALLQACPPSRPVPPVGSPLRRGRYSVGRALLGTTPGTTKPGMPERVKFAGSGAVNVLVCADGTTVRPHRPDHIDAAIYYPAIEESVDLTRTIPSLVHTGRQWPVILYAHAKRKALVCPQEVRPPLDRKVMFCGTEMYWASTLFSSARRIGVSVWPSKSKSATVDASSGDPPTNAAHCDPHRKKSISV